MNIGYSYLRFSNLSQADGDSESRQTAAAADWCQRNGVVLDTTTTFRDRGCSGWLGEHRSNPDRHALAAFLEMASPGPMRKILPGSYLIIENFDRLTREHIQPALLLVLNLLQTGIRIVQLHPEIIFDDKSGLDPILMMIVELSRANSESNTKSIRVTSAWAKKKILARREGVPMTRSMPPWLALVGGRFEVIEDRASIVRLVFRLARDGLGDRGIVQKFSREGVPPMGRSGRWTTLFVADILRDRRALGEHQPRIRSRKQRKKDGKPIPNYYPAIIDETEWYLANEARRLRKIHRGRQGHRVNVFAGLLKDAVNGGSFYSNTRVERGKTTRIIINSEGKEGRAEAATFPFDVFERAILERLREVPVAELEPTSDSVNELTTLCAERASLEARLVKIETELVDGEVAVLARVARGLELRLAELQQKIAEVRSQTAVSSVEEWSDAMNLVTALEAAKDPTTTRLRLRSLLRKTIDGIWLVIARVQKRRDRVCLAQVVFRGGKNTRLYVIWYRPAAAKRAAPEPIVLDGLESVESVDLRVREQARQLLLFFRASVPPFDLA